MGKKSFQNLSKCGFWTVLGSILEGVGAIWALIWALLDACWPFFLCSKFDFFQTWVSMGPRWAPRGLWHRFWVDFGRVWGKFWKVLGRFWWHFLKLFYVRTPALSREAPRSVS